MGTIQYKGRAFDAAVGDGRARRVHIVKNKFPEGPLVSDFVLLSPQERKATPNREVVISMSRNRKSQLCKYSGKNHPQHNPLGDGLGLNQGTCGYCGGLTEFRKRRDGVLVPKDHSPLR
jgi:hypothetical protein